MTEQEHIDALATHAPHPELTRKAKLMRNIGRVLVAVSFVLSTFAVVQVVRLATCTNTNLGQRSAPNNADSKVQLEWAVLVDKWLTAKPGPAMATAGEALAAYSVSTWYPTLKADAATKAAYPLGHC